MRILLDENLDPRLGPLLVGHECASVRAMDWRGLTNGELLRAAEGEFDAMITLDTGIARQQNLAGLKLRIILVRVPNNRWETVSARKDDILAAIPQAASGTVTEV